MKLLIVSLILLASLTLAFAQNCRPGQSVVCDYNSNTRTQYCRCQW